MHITQQPLMRLFFFFKTTYCLINLSSSWMLHAMVAVVGDAPILCPPVTLAMPLVTMNAVPILGPHVATQIHF